MSCFARRKQAEISHKDTQKLDDFIIREKFMRISAPELSFIKKMGVARVATVDAECVPHVTPVCPLVESSRIYFGSETSSKKVRNIKANPEIAIVFDEYHDSWRGLRGVMIHGRARLVDRKTFNRVRSKLYKKYPKYESDAALEFGESSVVEINPERKVSWGF
jgi:nitroimidazol reductase NimA-like FMN-containing flavoprotein (pyridoxamine 5'-phosphate oxidase superfamily)